MKVYAVMIESWNGEYDVTSVYAVYANEAAANEIVERVMSGTRSSYSPNYWVEEMEVIG
jgi:hypothetical protein